MKMKDDFDLVLRLKETRRNDLTDIKNLTITNPDGIAVPLDQVAEIGIQEGPNQVQREDAKRRITVAFNVRDRDVQSVVKEVQSKAEKTIALPAGYYVKYGGQFENLVEAKDRLMIDRTHRLVVDPADPLFFLRLPALRIVDLYGHSTFCHWRHFVVVDA